LGELALCKAIAWFALDLHRDRVPHYEVA
jgi:hypothetical protein